MCVCAHTNIIKHVCMLKCVSSMPTAPSSLLPEGMPAVGCGRRLALGVREAAAVAVMAFLVCGACWWGGNGWRPAGWPAIVWRGGGGRVVALFVGYLPPFLGEAHHTSSQAYAYPPPLGCLAPSMSMSSLAQMTAPQHPKSSAGGWQLEPELVHNKIFPPPIMCSLVIIIL